MKADEIYAVELDGLEDGDLAGRLGPFDHLTKAKTAVREAMASRRSPEEVIRFALVQVRDVMEFEPRVVYRERTGNGHAPVASDFSEGVTEPIDGSEAAVGYSYTTVIPVDVEEAAGDAS